LRASIQTRSLRPPRAANDNVTALARSAYRLAPLLVAFAALLWALRGALH